MMSTTFGYDPLEDRIWMSNTGQGEQERIWLTRRLAQYLVGPMAQSLENTTTEATGGGDVATRIRLEHEMALNEPQPGQPLVPFKMGRDEAKSRDGARYVLCHNIQTTLKGGQCEMSMQTAVGERRLQFSRVGLHRWLRAFSIVLQATPWNLNPPPAPWLTQSYLPQALRTLLDKPLPDQLDD